MINTPVVKLGIVAVSRDCFPMQLSACRRKAVVAAGDFAYETLWRPGYVLCRC